MIALGDRGLGNERTEARLVGLFGEVEELFVCDVQLSSQLAEPGRHLGEASLDERARHGRSLGGRPDGSRRIVASSSRDCPLGDGERQTEPVRLVAWFVAAALCAGACGSSSSSASCGPILREELDPGSSIHVLPNAVDVEYASDPPTSGPHQPVPDLVGLQDQPLPRPVQVGVIEDGGILVQYDPAAFADTSELAALADGVVVIAPNPDLDDPVVLTAWTAKQTCSTVAPEAVASFVEDRQGKAPGSDP